MKSISDPDFFYKSHTIVDCVYWHIMLLHCLWENRVQEIPKLCAICCLTDWYRTQLLTFFNSTKNSSHMFSNFKTDVLQVFLQPFCKTISARLFCKTIFARLFPAQALSAICRAVIDMKCTRDHSFGAGWCSPTYVVIDYVMVIIVMMVIHIISITYNGPLHCHWIWIRSLWKF